MRAARRTDPAAIADVVLRIAGELGASDVTVYLVDFAQTTLEPVPDRSPHAEIPTSEDVATTMAGRAFSTGAGTAVKRRDGVRVWVPVVEGSDRTGVLGLTLPELTDALLVECEELGEFTGYLIATHSRGTDLYNLYRRRRALSLAASMQWDLLPPLVLKTSRLVVAGFLEPAYEVGGDCFDYALNDTAFDVAIFDAMGHGVTSSMIAALGIGCYRHDRREGRTLAQMHASLDTALASHLPDLLFATGQLARIDLESGVMTWTNAGHPLPFLIRNGRVTRELDCITTLPWGLGALEPDADRPVVSSVALEPGDTILFFTDGVTESHDIAGGALGSSGLADLVGQHVSDQLEVEEVLRLLVRSLIGHQAGDLRDDATLVMVQWRGGSASSS